MHVIRVKVDNSKFKNSRLPERFGNVVSRGREIPVYKKPVSVKCKQRKVYMSEATAKVEDQNQDGDSNQLELNKGDNFILGIDVSASMTRTDCANNASRINYLKETAIAFATEASKWDDDGIDIISFGDDVKTYPNVTDKNAEEIINKLQANEGSTDTAGLINAAYELHKKGGYKQTVLFVFTDGLPSDKKAVEKAIIDITNDIKDEHEFAISFMKVGKESSVDSWLAMLDDDLTKAGAKYDIVDVKDSGSVNFKQAFAGALHD